MVVQQLQYRRACRIFGYRETLMIHQHGSLGGAHFAYLGGDGSGEQILVNRFVDQRAFGIGEGGEGGKCRRLPAS